MISPRTSTSSRSAWEKTASMSCSVNSTPMRRSRARHQGGGAGEAPCGGGTGMTLPILTVEALRASYGLAEAGDRRVGKGDDAGTRRHEAHDRLEGGGLAGAVAAHAEEVPA
jgi:hypothetical protein